MKNKPIFPILLTIIILLLVTSGYSLDLKKSEVIKYIKEASIKADSVCFGESGLVEYKKKTSDIIEGVLTIKQNIAKYIERRLDKSENK